MLHEVKSWRGDELINKHTDYYCHIRLARINSMQWAAIRSSLDLETLLEDNFQVHATAGAGLGGGKLSKFKVNGVEYNVRGFMSAWPLKNKAQLIIESHAGLIKKINIRGRQVKDFYFDDKRTFLSLSCRPFISINGVIE